MKKEHIIVATLVFGEVPYFPFVKRINEKYCSIYRYPFKILEMCADKERAAIWGKVSGVQTLLEFADYVLFLDADAYFVDHSRSIDSFISEHMHDASFVVGTDRRDRDFAWSDFNANTGTFLVKNSEWGRTVLDTWWRSPIQYDRRWLWKWPPEQGAFNFIVRHLFGPGVIRVIPYHYMNGRDGQFIRHLIGMSTDERIAVLKNEITKLKID